MALCFVDAFFAKFGARKPYRHATPSPTLPGDEHLLRVRKLNAFALSVLPSLPEKGGRNPNTERDFLPEAHQFSRNSVISPNKSCTEVSRARNDV